MTFEQHISLPTYVMFEAFDNEGVLLDIRTQEHYGLDEVGTLFFSAIRDGIPLKKAFADMLEVYDVTPEQLHSDLDQLIQTLHSHALIELS